MEDHDVFLESGFGVRTKKFLQALRGRRRSTHALEIVMQSLLEKGAGIRSLWNSDSKALSLLVKAANKKEAILRSLFENAKSNEVQKHRERLRKFDALLKFSFGVLRLSRRPARQCHTILAKAFYSDFSNAIQPVDLKTYNYSGSVNRFADQIKKRLQRLKARRS